jgi:ribonuclease E
LPTEIVTGMPKVQSFVLPLGELAQVAESSGLSWINSDATKIAAVQAGIAAEPKAIHVPRVRPAVTQIQEEPLVLVETKRDLKDLTLPFEEKGVQ